VLVIVHQDEAVGVLRHVGVVVVLVVCVNGDVQLHALGVEVVPELGDEGAVAGLRGERELFEIEGEAAILVAGEKEIEFLAETSARGGIVEEGYDVFFPDAGDRVEVVHHGEDFGFGVLGFEERHQLFVNDAGAIILVYDVVELVQFGDGLEISVGGENVEPLGIEQVDLVNIFAERGETGGVPGDVEGAADAFVLVQDDLGRCDTGLAVRADFLRMLALLLTESVVGLLLDGEEDLADIGVGDDGDDEDNGEQRKQDAEDVESAANTLSALALRIEEYRFGHGEVTLIC
jgi:hypothetical protein